MRVVNAGKAAALVAAALTLAACGDEPATAVAAPGGTTEARGDVVLASTSLAPNLPAGSTTISSQGFETCAGDGWVNCAAATRDAEFAIVQDASAPASNPSVARYTFPSGFTGGDAPVPIIERGVPAGTKRLYGSFWFKLSPNWQGHNTGINKLGFVWIHGQPVVYLNAQGSGSAPLVLQVRTQGLGVGTSARTLGPNRGQSGVISRGEWHRLEYFLAANTAGQQNGAVRFWLDGTEIGSYTDVGFSSSSQRTDWELASVYPVWGGSGDRVRSTQQLFVDHYLLASATTSAPAPAPAPSPVPVARVAVVPSSFTLTVGGSQQLSATTYDANGATLTGRTITWSSSNAGVASVSATGLVSAVAAGSATLTATSEGQRATATVTVNAPAPQQASVARVAVSPSSATLTVGGTQQLTATTYDANNATLTGRTVTWTSSNAGVASVSGSGLVTAVAAGSATVTATSEGRTAAATITVNAPAPAPAPAPTGGQEPSGSTRLTERAFSLANEDGWLSPMGYWSITSDAAAPRSASQVGQILYPAGFGGGSEPVRLEKSFSQRFRTLYVSYWLKPSSNFVGHGTGVNKTLHLWIGGGNRIYLTMQGQGNGALLAQVNLQGIPTDGGARNLPPNVVTGAQIQRNQWQRWEIVAVANTPGVSDGSLQWWVNGTRVASYTGLQFVRSGESNTWELIQVAPTWGGIGGTVPANQYLWLDHLYVSGR